MLINDTKLLIALEELFKQEPFNYEHGSLFLNVDRGSINFINGDPAEENIEELEATIERLYETIEELEETIEELQEEYDE